MHLFLKSVNLKPDGWMWYFPQYHIIIFLLVLAAIAFLIILMRQATKNSARLDMLIAQLIPTTCPCCHNKTLVTLQRCTSPQCQTIMVLKDQTSRLSAPTLQPLQHAPGD